MINVDRLKLFPEQMIENRPTECAGETVGDILGNITGVPMDAGFSYAMALRLAKSEPTTAGADPYLAMQSGFFYGGLPVSAESFDAVGKSELYEANWKNYGSDQISLALQYAQKGIVVLQTYQEIIGYLNAVKWPVMMTMKWYQSFNSIADGVLRDPGGIYTLHTVEVCGEDAEGEIYIKPWLGKKAGNSGYFSLSEEMFKETETQWYAYGYDPNAIRLWSIIAFSAARLRLPIGDLSTQFQTWMSQKSLRQ